MAVVIAQEPVGHPRAAGELDGLMREPERLLAQADRPPFPRPGVEPARGDPGERQPDQPESEQARPEGGGSSIRMEPEPTGPDRPDPLGEVPGRHRAHDRRELVAVPGRRQAQGAEGDEHQAPEDRRLPAPKRRLAGTLGRLLRPGRLLLLRTFGKLLDRPGPLRPVRHRYPDLPGHRHEEAQGPSTKTSRWSWSGRLSRPTSSMNFRSGLSSPIEFLKIGLLIVPAS